MTRERVIERVVSAFRERFGEAPEVVTWAPGRVSLLGAHVDYSEGLVLSCAIDRGIAVAASNCHLAENQLELVALDVDSAGIVDAALGADDPPDWAAVPVATERALDSLRRDRERPRPSLGLRAVFGGDLPIGAGVSSSAALEVALLGAWCQLLGWDDLAADRLELARLARRAETEFLGVGSGLMDPHASLFGKRDGVVFLDCRSEAHEILPLAGESPTAGDAPPPVVLLVDSGVRRRLVGSGFGDRRAECAAAVEALQRTHPRLRSIRTLRDVAPSDLERAVAQGAFEPLLARRARHAVEEIARVRRAAEDLRQGRLAAFGAAMRASHESSRDLYDTSIPALDVLAAAAWTTPGCYGARLTGAGFGGLVVALVEAAAVDSVREAMEQAASAAFGRRPVSFTTRASSGAWFGEVTERPVA